MKKWILVLVLLIVGLAGLVFYRSQQPTEQIPLKSIHHFLPGNSPFVIEVQHLRKLPESVSRLEVSQAAQDSPLASFYKQRLLPAVRVFQHADAANFPNSLLNVNRYIGDQALLYAETNPRGIIGVLKLHSNDQSSDEPYSKHDQLLNTHIIQPLNTSKQFHYEQQNRFGVTIHQFEPRLTSQPNKNTLAGYLRGTSFSLSRVRNHLLVGFGPSSLKTVISRYNETKHPADGLFTGTAPEQFQARFRLEPGYLLKLFEHLARTRAGNQSVGEASSFQNQQLEALTGIKGDVFEKDGFLTVEADLEWDPKQQPDTPAQPQDQTPRTLQFNQYLPAKTVFSQNQLIPEADKLFLRFQNHVLRSAGLADSLAEDSKWLPTKGIHPFLHVHEEEFGWAVYYNDRFFESVYRGQNPGISSPPLHLITGFEITDMSQLNSALEDLATNPFIDYNPGTREIHVDYILGELPIYLEQDHSFLLMTTDPNIPGDPDQSREDSANLTSRASYQVVRKKFPEQLNALVYFSGREFTAPLRYSWLQRFMPNRSRQIKQFMGFDPVSEIHKIARQTHPSMGGVWNQPERQRTRLRFHTSGDIVFPVAVLGSLGAVQAYLQTDLTGFINRHGNNPFEQMPGDTELIKPELE